MMNNNSLKAYYEGEYTGRFSVIRCNVLKFITQNPNLTRQDLVEKMNKEYNGGYEINVVTGRVRELLESNLIVDSREAPRGRLKSNFIEAVA